jgi:hypothetical protein
MADELITFAITTGVFVALGAILFGVRAKRYSSQKESNENSANRT